MQTWERHREVGIWVPAPPADVFAFLDNPAALGAHIGERSFMLMGGRMTYGLDAAQGRAVGSVIRMEGSVLGLLLAASEVVTERVPPTRKTWQTIGAQRMIVIAQYRMGFDITPTTEGCRVKMFIDYDLPATVPGRLLGIIADGKYAAWCLSQMAGSAQKRFAQAHAANSP